MPPCPLNLRFKTKPVTAGADATVYAGFWIHVNKRLTNNVADILIIFTKVGVPFKIPLGVKIDSF